ncbi:hypothetical protein [Microcoleus sp. S13_C3]|uniref:hypothetical protein n=1 Tax=Microcoleus sp. S13_C3 TaxID=3055409 RepID=UPI002FD05F0E
MCQKSQYSYLVGQELTEKKREIYESSNLLEQLKESIKLHGNQIFHQKVLNLLSQPDSFGHLFTDYQEDNLLERCTKLIFSLKIYSRYNCMVEK